MNNNKTVSMSYSPTDTERKVFATLKDCDECGTRVCPECREDFREYMSAAMNAEHFDGRFSEPTTLAEVEAITKAMSSRIIRFGGRKIYDRHSSARNAFQIAAEIVLTGDLPEVAK